MIEEEEDEEEGTARARPLDSISRESPTLWMREEREEGDEVTLHAGRSS